MWKVKHADPKDCEAVKEDSKGTRQQEARTKNDARNNLRKLCERSEYYVHGKGHQPQGTEIEISGSRTRPTGEVFGLLLSQAANTFGMWRTTGPIVMIGRNNVSTGGAGAIGYRVPYTEKAEDS